MNLGPNTQPKVADTTSLSIHTRGSQRVSREQLRRLPEPVSMGRLHRPIPHHQLVDVIEDQLFDRGWTINRMQLGINQGGKALFGIMDLKKHHHLQAYDEEDCQRYR